VVLAVSETVKGFPGRRGIAAMHVQPAAQRHGLARWQGNGSPRLPNLATAVAVSEPKPGGLIRGREQRHPPGPRRLEDVHDRREQQRPGRAFGGETRHGFQVMAGELPRPHLLVAILQEFPDAQRGEPPVARAAGGGQRKVNTLLGGVRTRLDTAEEHGLHRLRLIRLVANGNRGFEQVLACAGSHQPMAEFNVQRPEPRAGPIGAQPDHFAVVGSAPAARRLQHACSVRR